MARKNNGMTEKILIAFTPEQFEKLNAAFGRYISTNKQQTTSRNEFIRRIVLDECEKVVVESKEEQ